MAEEGQHRHLSPCPALPWGVALVLSAFTRRHRDIEVTARARDTAGTSHAVCEERATRPHAAGQKFLNRQTPSDALRARETADRGRRRRVRGQAEGGSLPQCPFLSLHSQKWPKPKTLSTKDSVALNRLNFVPPRLGTRVSPHAPELHLSQVLITRHHLTALLAARPRLHDMLED